MSYAGDYHWEWLKRQKIDHVCSELGREVANILGYVGCGLYNAPINIHKIDWSDPYVIDVIWSTPLSNWDRPELTLLWVECARRMIRVSIEGCAPHRLRLLFHKREMRHGGISKRLPDVEELVSLVDGQWGRTAFRLP